jgi:hypothetical protein
MRRDCSPTEILRNDERFSAAAVTEFLQSVVADHPAGLVRCLAICLESPLVSERMIDRDVCHDRLVTQTLVPDRQLRQGPRRATGPQPAIRPSLVGDLYLR